MPKGVVKWFNADKGYGFIEPEGGGNDIFVHISEVQQAGLQTLENDQAIEFEMIDGMGGRQMAGKLSVGE
ncbi:cold-shock protein [Amylibacter sp. IMCC11727]|uniref:cold-shock protein n=1 Tax=Amylibacter sp. IMCC11727 TaxID=3039851 RepID=UPI00244DD486|nr:cold-shock protein [Amylibacter sp. IMCC11727]WGI22984.1 cold-shock protein [Amylibacter sp. IMCC11727]